MFEKVREALAAAAAVDLGLLASSVLAEEIRELHGIELSAVAERLRRLEVFDRIAGYTDDGHLTAVAWVRNELGLSHGTASAELSVARVRRTCPQLAAVFDAGRTSFRHLQAAAAAMRRLPQPEIWQLVDEKIAGWAQDTTVAAFAEMLDKLVEQLLPEPKPKDEKQRDRRRLAVSTGFDGMVNVAGRLTPETGEKLSAALSAASRPDIAGETRTSGQRKADALDHVLDTVLDTALLPVDGGEKPHLTVLVDLDQLAADHEAAAPAGAGHGAYWTQTAEQRQQHAQAAAAIAEAVDRQPRFSWTGPATPGTARRLACDSILLPIFTRGGQPIDVGRRTRVITAPMRAFIVARDRHCRWPGCTIPARWTQVHHTVHWRDGGPTDRWSLILLCDAHHHAAHDGHWTITLHAPGHITVRTRQPGDPYYEIKIKTPPPSGDPPHIDDLLTTAARHLKATA